MDKPHKKLRAWQLGMEVNVEIAGQLKFIDQETWGRIGQKAN
jgi:hypothetical protein